MRATDTIVALSTPPGRSGIGVVRLSGPSSLGILHRLVRDVMFIPEPAHAVLCQLYELTTGELLDDALVTFFRAPNSFTGDDVVELSCHGSPVLLRRIIDLVLSLDARLAGPGEFTLRAVASGKLNLVQAEAIRDLINAQTRSALRQAARQMKGELATRLQPIKESLIDIIVTLESSLEFVEDDLPDMSVENIDRQLSKLVDELERLSATFNEGRLLRDGLKVALIGRPNVGKSSLFNSLLSNERAIVTDVAGTTRDSLTETTSIRGIPVTITDTAGVRASDDMIETLGVERTRRAMADSDMVVLVLDGSLPITIEDRELLSELNHTEYVIAVNKLDLASFSSEVIRTSIEQVPIIEVSATKLTGLNALCDAILAPFAGNEHHETGLLITDARHNDLLIRAVRAVVNSSRLFRERASEELVLVGLNDALRYLGEITGETTTENILSRIFATFCVGK